VDPAHLVPRSLGSYHRPECVVPLCRLHHRTARSSDTREAATLTLEQLRWVINYLY
jgi:hypothetical protein